MDNELIVRWMNAGNAQVPTLLLRHYKDLNISNDELVLILQLKSYMDKGDLFPSTDKIAKSMHMTEQNVFKAIHQLIQKKILFIDTKKDASGRTEDTYSLDLLWERLIIHLKQQETTKMQHVEQEQTKNIYSMFEAEFGRSLTPIETETLVAWIEDDHYHVDLIKLALKEAVLNQVYSMKYIDRILLSWEKKNLRTKEQVEKEMQRFRNYKSSQQENDTQEEIDKYGPVPMVNWLKDTD